MDVNTERPKIISVFWPFQIRFKTIREKVDQVFFALRHAYEQLVGNWWSFKVDCEKVGETSELFVIDLLCLSSLNTRGSLKNSQEETKVCVTRNFRWTEKINRRLVQSQQVNDRLIEWRWKKILLSTRESENSGSKKIIWSWLEWGVNYYRRLAHNNDGNYSRWVHFLLYFPPFFHR